MPALQWHLVLYPQSFHHCHQVTDHCFPSLQHALPWNYQQFYWHTRLLHSRWSICWHVPISWKGTAVSQIAGVHTRCTQHSSMKSNVRLDTLAIRILWKTLNQNQVVKDEKYERFIYWDLVTSLVTCVFMNTKLLVRRWSIIHLCVGETCRPPLHVQLDKPFRDNHNRSNT